MNITAVVVTYNRVDLLLKCLSSLEVQDRKLDKIIIVDNCSTDGTQEKVRAFINQTSSDIELLELDSNQGGAGGFHHGMVRAYDSGADYIWVMDDDCIPTEGALKALETCVVANQGKKLGFLSSYVAFKDGSTCISNAPGPFHLWLNGFSSSNHGSGYVQLAWATFVSCLVSREAIESVGYPVKEFFIWGDDIEFTTRVSGLYPCYFVPQSLVYHLPAENRPNTYNHVNDQSLWKFKYAMRNVVAFIRTTQPQGVLRAFNYWRGAFKEMRLGKVKKTHMLILFREWFKGLFFNYTKLIKKVGK